MSDIRNQLSRGVGPPESPIDLAALHRRARSRQQRRRAALAGMAAVAMLGIGGLAWAPGSDDQQVSVGQDPGLISETTTVPDDATTTTEMPTTTDATTTTTTTTTTPTPTTTDATTTTAPTNAPPSTTEPATTSTAPVTVPPVETTLPPTIGHRQFSGHHRGEGLPYEPSPGDCAMFAHQLDGVFTLDTGEDWDYHADYCGTVDANSLWTGAGTFAFTTPDGDSLTGTFTSRAVLPTKGEPYSLTVTGGTGAWAGASGSCSLTNHITVFPSGMQEQAGRFTCDIQTSPASVG